MVEARKGVKNCVLTVFSHICGLPAAVKTSEGGVCTSDHLGYIFSRAIVSEFVTTRHVAWRGVVRPSWGGR